MSKRFKYAKVNIASITTAVITAALISSTLLTGCTKGREVTPEPAQQEEGFTPLTEEALAEIEEKGYAAPYAADKRKLIKIGATFDSEERNLKEWEVV